MKQNLPEAEIDVLVMFKSAGEIYHNNPFINKLLRFDFINEGIFRSLRFLFSLRKNYVATINVYPSNRKEYNIISFLIGTKKRAAVNYKRKNFSSMGFLNNITVDEDDSLHNVQTNIKLCEKLLGTKFNDEPALELNLTQADLSFADNYLKEKNIGTHDFVVGFHPGCATLKNHIKRRWEPEKFAELGRNLIQNKNAKILIFGGPEELELKKNISSQIDSENVQVVGTNTILHSAAIMRRCNVFVTNDSSQMHIASALQLKVVAIIGPTNPAYIHPWKTKHEIVSLNLDCSPCFFYSPRPLICTRTDVKFKCIKELSVGMVYNAITKILS